MMPTPFLRGVFATVLTPFDGWGCVEYLQLREHAEFLDRSPVDGLCVGGRASQTAGCSPEELASIVEKVASATRKPVLAGIHLDSIPEAIRLARAVAAAGAAGILASQPDYLFQPDQAGLAELFLRLKDAVPVPVLAANNCGAALMDLASLRVLIDQGVLDGICQGEDPHLLTDLLGAEPRPPVLSAIEELMYPAFLLGAEGVVSDLAALFPDDCAALYHACRSQDHARARAIHERLLRIWRVLNHPAQLLARLKHAAAVMGHPVGAPRSPYDWFPEDGQQQVRGVLLREGKLS